MGSIQTSLLPVDPPLAPPAGTILLYAKSAGLFTMDEFGAIQGPFTGGSGPPTGVAGGSLSGTYPNPAIAANAVGSSQLAAASVISGKIGALAVGTAELANLSVTTGKIANDAVQTAQIANAAVTGPKVADGTLGASKLQNPSGIYKVAFANTASSWAFDYLPRVQFGTDPAGPFIARISLLGDLGTANSPLFPRIVNHDSNTPLGYLNRVLSYAVTGSEDLAARTDNPTVFQGTNVAPATVTLPDSRKYPLGMEILFYVESSAATLTVAILGSSPPFTNIVGPSPATPQSIVPGTGRRFVGFQDGWRLTGTF